MPLSASLFSVLDFVGASGASYSPDDAFLYHGFDDSAVKGVRRRLLLVRQTIPRLFIMWSCSLRVSSSFFPHVKPFSSFSSKESYPWMDIFSMATRCDPRIFLDLFNKLSSVSKEVNEKFRKTADDKKKASTTLSHWGDIYHLGDLDVFHRLRPPRSMRVFLGY